MALNCRGCGGHITPKTGEVHTRRLDGSVRYRPECLSCRRDRRLAVRGLGEPLPRTMSAVERTRLLDYDGIYVAAQSDRVVVTYAQNATPEHHGFFLSLLGYCDVNSAQLVIIPGHYHNPTSVWTRDDEEEDWWARPLQPYLLDGRRMTFGDHLVIYGDISIQPTAIRPLTGFEVFAGTSSAIFGHPKIQLSCIPTARRRYPRILTSTGAVTVRNYTDSKAGKKGDAHHVFGATLVERSGTKFHLRQLNADSDGVFTDLDRIYSADGVEAAPRPLALVCGDIHVDRADAAAMAATFDRDDSIVRTLRPEKVVYHDLLDFEVRNHHTIKDPVRRFLRAVGYENDIVEDEIDRAIEFLDDRAPEDTETLVIRSNHDEAFDKWLKTADPKTDPLNAPFYHEMWALLLRHYAKVGHDQDNAFELVYRQRGSGRAKFVHRNDELVIGGVVCNFHGDKGLGGSRGSILTYSKLGVRTIIGHSHQPGILEGAYQVGLTGELDQKYNDLPSAWMHAHALIYASGKRTLLFVIGDEWRRDDRQLRVFPNDELKRAACLGPQRPARRAETD